MKEIETGAHSYVRYSELERVRRMSGISLDVEKSI